ncbi:MAG: bifunctional phosphoserine phosphatase/homoserine phosphotransferase ThrH [Verrucomicrobia bacterium]|nr:bifunctional phosphoserine phosphatase/homoserine phosphotransferase ThrH [Verrucomicrobiota bacterium]MBI3867960.1 bifunctional phosphoserine phosphatase/homoserine phosphotransferase ThrH [Verrucomicrobiota bacterium]
MFSAKIPGRQARHPGAPENLNLIPCRAPGKTGLVKQSIVTLDLEGVLVPEIWIAVAEKTSIPELRLTTRDIPDYDVLMKGRLKLLEKHGLKLVDIQEVIAGLRPLPGGAEFLAQLRSRAQVVILSDTFEEFAKPFMSQLGWPTLLCHRLEVSKDGRVVGYRLRQSDQKRKCVAAFKQLGYSVIAAGDSFNDTTMLAEADHGFLFHSPESIQRQFPQFPALERYEDLLKEIMERL